MDFNQYVKADWKTQSDQYFAANSGTSDGSGAGSGGNSDGGGCLMFVVAAFIILVLIFGS